ncbi:phosphoglycerate dehydrogenase [bacterium]|nr:phosphoglycerate dehydrogenase [bacterium]
MKILISDEMSSACVEKLQTNFEVDYKTGLTQEQLLAIVPQYSAWVVRSSTKVTAKLIEAGTSLKIIGRAGAGVDNIDVEAATQRGIVVMNTPGGNTISTAEHTIAMIMALSRNIPQADQSVKKGEWKKSKFTGTELFEKTLGVLGVGKVGREVAIRMKSFGMNVIGYDPIFSNEEAERIGIRLVSLNELFASSDYITIHTPLNKATENLINHDTLKQCKDGVKIVNCARGGIIDETALQEALTSGKVSGAALDVFAAEPPGDHPLFKLPNVITTPHLGASTEEAQEKVAIQIAEQLISALNGKTITGAVNLMPIDQDVFSKSAAYLRLTSRMGHFASQWINSPISKINVHYFGDVLHHPTNLLTQTLIAGLFKTMIEQVNIVNAPAIARKQGIDISETRSTEHQDFTHLITLEIVTNDRSQFLWGTLYGKNDPRIVGINGYIFDAHLDGAMLVLSNEDKPGMIGRLGTILGNHGINIAQMSLGRKGAGGKAMTILNVDDACADNVIRELEKQGFTDIRFIQITNEFEPYRFRVSE